MTDREKLEKLISEIQYMGGLESRLAEHLLANGVTFSVAVPGHENNYDIAEMSYNNGYAKGLEDGKPKWIPVTERLPEKEGMYLCLVKSYASQNGKFHKIFRFYKRFGFCADGFRRDDIIHWMPLPEPPKVADHE